MTAVPCGQGGRWHKVGVTLPLQLYQTDQASGQSILASTLRMQAVQNLQLPDPPHSRPVPRQEEQGTQLLQQLLFLPLFTAVLLLSHVPAEVIKDLAPLLGLINGFVAGVTHQLGQLTLPP